MIRFRVYRRGAQGVVILLPEAARAFCKLLKELGLRFGDEWIYHFDSNTGMLVGVTIFEQPDFDRLWTDQKVMDFLSNESGLDLDLI